MEQARAAIRANDRRKARDLLTRLLKVDSHNARYWLWMASVVDTPKEAIYCLSEAAKYDSSSQIVRRGLTFFGARKPDKNPPENLFTQRSNWQEEMVRAFAPPPPEKPVKKKQKAGISVYLAGALILVLLAAAGIFLMPRVFRHQSAPVTLVRPTFKASATYLPTATPKGFRPSPTPKLAPALWMLLSATYTPTPLYVETPHPSEAYQLAMRAFAKNDWETFNRYMDQFLQDSPGVPDAYYYMGEAARLNKQNNQALMYYEKAMNLDPKFAAAILAHAKLLKQVKPKSNILDDLDKAIKADPYLFDAYITRARLYMEKNQLDLAMEDLQTAKDMAPESPLVYLSLAQVYLAQNDPKAAIENAQKAYDLDITMLDTYLVMGSAYIADGQSEKALEYLNTYLEYQPYDAAAYEMVGKAYWVAGNTDKALENLNKSISMDTNSFDAYYILGVTSFKSGDPANALNYLTKALDINDNHYEAVFYRAQALLQLKRNTDAYNQFLRAEDLSTTDEDKAACIYYQARAALAIGSRSNINDAYKRLMAMPESVMPAEWRTEAYNYLNPCKPKQCATLTATYAIGAPLTTTGTTTPSGLTTTPTATATTASTPTPTRTDTLTPTQTPVLR